jgi:hypothetical protein
MPDMFPRRVARYGAARNFPGGPGSTLVAGLEGRPPILYAYPRVSLP